MHPPIGLSELHPPKVLERLRAQRETRARTRTQWCYELRIDGHTWNEIAEITGYSCSNSACTAAVLYETTNDVPQMPRTRIHKPKASKRARAYELRLNTKMTWKAIALEVGYPEGCVAQQEAIRWARRWGHPLPKKRQLGEHQK